jgi:ABC-2 type transport system ATP-binding protein
MNAIEVNHLSKHFGSFKAVDDISFSVKAGEVFGFLGANGAGKSTTIKMLCGILEPTSGDALIAGSSIKKEPDDVKKKIGYMSQRFSLYNDLTVEENINFFGGIYGLEGKNLAERKAWVLKMSDLSGKEKLLTGSLPGGIKQRLAIGTAVIHKPKIVFLDEPTSGVDPISRRSFWDLINDLSSEGITVLVTTHYLEEAEYCENIILINAGKIIAEGNPGKLKSDHIKYPLFEIETDNISHAMKHFEEAAFIEEASIFGNYIHILVNEKFSEEKEINDLLLSNGISSARIEKINPSLEDVFIHLLEREKND